MLRDKSLYTLSQAEETKDAQKQQRHMNSPNKKFILNSHEFLRNVHCCFANS